MRRIYLAAVIMALCVGLSAWQYIDIEKSVSDCTKSIEKAVSLVKNDKAEKALDICKKNAESFEERFSLMYCYCDHRLLESIDVKLDTLTSDLRFGNKSAFFTLAETAKRELEVLGKREEIRLENIL